MKSTGTLGLETNTLCLMSSSALVGARSIRRNRCFLSCSSKQSKKIFLKCTKRCFPGLVGKFKIISEIHREVFWGSPVLPLLNGWNYANAFELQMLWKILESILISKDSYLKLLFHDTYCFIHFWCCFCLTVMNKFLSSARCTVTAKARGEWNLFCWWYFISNVSDFSGEVFFSGPRAPSRHFLFTRKATSLWKTRGWTFLFSSCARICTNTQLLQIEFGAVSRDFCCDNGYEWRHLPAHLSNNESPIVFMESSSQQTSIPIVFHFHKYRDWFLMEWKEAHWFDASLRPRAARCF